MRMWRTPDEGGSPHYFFQWMWFLCSLLSKQTLVTLPFVFLVLDWYPLGRLRVERGERVWFSKKFPA